VGEELESTATPHHIELGRAGEEAAVASYRRAGYRVVARNWRCPLGEIDLVLSRGRTVVFCEVKTRRGTAFGLPFEAVTHKKQRRLRLLAEAFLRLAATGLGPRDADIRFDVASVTLDRQGRLSLNVFEGAF
jgi:putative endonuclease